MTNETKIILLALGLAMVFVGFICATSGVSGITTEETKITSNLRFSVGVIVCLGGIVWAVLVWP